MLERYMREFIGYGNLEAPLWFLGLEEAGSRSSDDLFRRVDAWTAYGCNAVVDLVQFHDRLGIEHLFGDRPKIQATWRRLIQIALVSQGEEVNPESIARFQATRLGRLDGENLLGELLPLPKATTRSWPYGDLAERHSFLRTRRQYQRHLVPIRVALLREAIRSYQPRTVIFYGTTRRRLWEQIAETSLADNEVGFAYAKSHASQYLLVKHPNARGVSGSYYDAAARSVS
ncbi:MAG: hypothetical protein AAF266_12625 [Planctomycetota bacterium]